MIVYLDADVLVAFWIENDAQSDRAAKFFLANSAPLVVSNFAAAEFASTLARQVRMKLLQTSEASGIFARFDIWCARVARAETITTADVASAAGALRRLDLNLRAPDAIHIATADRIGAELATFDKRMAKCARTLGVGVVFA